MRQRTLTYLLLLTNRGKGLPAQETTGRRLGQYLRALRTSRELTMRQAAALAGITQGYLSQIENGIYVPSAKTIGKLARAYGIGEVDLLLSAGVISEPVHGKNAHAPGSEPAEQGAEHVLQHFIELTRQGISPLSDERLVPLFDCNGNCLHNVIGRPTGIRLPLHFCGYDRDAFLLEAADDDLSPLILAGDWVVVSPATPVHGDEIAALRDGLRFILRRYCTLDGMLGFHPSTASAPSWNPDSLKEHGITLIGRVLRVVSRELNRQRAAAN